MTFLFYIQTMFMKVIPILHLHVPCMHEPVLRQRSNHDVILKLNT